MITHHARGVIKARLHVGAREARIFFQHVLDRITGGKEFQNRLHRDARAADDWTPVANIRSMGRFVLTWLHVNIEQPKTKGKAPAARITAFISQV